MLLLEELRMEFILIAMLHLLNLCIDASLQYCITTLFQCCIHIIYVQYIIHNQHTVLWFMFSSSVRYNVCYRSNSTEASLTVPQVSYICGCGDVMGRVFL